MSTNVFPSLAGLGWNVVRTPMWRTSVYESVSGKETAVSYWSSPRYQWELTYDFLRTAPATAELQNLIGFFATVKGRFDTWLYTDGDDNAVTGQAIGTGNGTTTAFQLQRSFGGALDPILAVNAVSAVRVAGVTQAGNTWSVPAWGQTNQGMIVFNSAPANGAAIVADFTYYWPCRFLEDSITFEKFMTGLYSGKSVKFVSQK